jgi:tRNA G18 (ribose-2'-O)-methylase SpoU
VPLSEIESADDPRLAPYAHVADAGWLREHGLFVAEGRLVVRTLLTASAMGARSILVTRPALDGLADVLTADSPLPILLVPQAVMNGIVGFNIHRGCLALGERPPERSLTELLGTAASAFADATADRRSLGGGWSAKPPYRASTGRLVVLENVSNADNVGGIFRCAAAFGAAVVLGPHCGDPLYRKAIRTSMGAALRVPFAAAAPWPASLDDLRAAGYVVVALTPSNDAEDLDRVASDLARRPKVALLAGAEGEGLTDAALASSDRRVRIGIDPAVDSLNVAVATGIALHLVGLH